MRTFLVTITKTVTAEVEVSARNEESAEKKALKEISKGNVEWYDDGEPEVVDIDC